MPSSKTNGISKKAVTPQRSHGRARVAALLESASAVIAEKGFDDATMAEIAARARSPIGSLYRFFPNKEILAGALIERYGTLMEQAFDVLDESVKGKSPGAIADLILDFMLGIRAEARAMLGFLNARAEWTALRIQFRALLIKRLAKTLRALSPSLSTAGARDTAVILLHNMKTMAALKFDKNAATSPGAEEELRRMNRLYLTNRLGKKISN